MCVCMRGTLNVLIRKNQKSFIKFASYLREEYDPRARYIGANLISFKIIYSCMKILVNVVGVNKPIYEKGTYDGKKNDE